MCGGRAAGMARGTRRVLLTRVKRESLENTKRSRGALRLFTLQWRFAETHIGAEA
jgi:hypothetical protein